MRPVAAAPFLVVVALLLSPGSAEGVSAHRRTETVGGNYKSLAPIESFRPVPINLARPKTLLASSRSFLRHPLIVAPSTPPLAAQPKSPSAPPPTKQAAANNSGVGAQPAQDVGRTVTVGGAASSGEASAVPLTVLQRKIRWCESRDNYQAQNSASTASGGWQFLDSTWHSNSHLPGRARDYPQAVQDRVFLLVFAEQGTRPWVSSESCWR